MITNYSRPQLLIRQILEKLEVATVPGLNALVIGPQFDLHRINNADEFDEMSGTGLNIPGIHNEVGSPAAQVGTDADGNSLQVVPFEGYNTNSIIKDDYTKLYGKDLEAVLVKYGFCAGGNDIDVDDPAQDATGANFSITSVQTPHKIAATDVNGNPITLDIDSSNPTLHSSLRGRPVKPGDYVYVTYKGGTTRRTVLGLEQGLSAAAQNEVKNATNNPNHTVGASSAVVTCSVAGNVASGTFAPNNADVKKYLSSGVNYNNEFAERFTVRVTTPTGKGNAAVGRATVSSASGSFYKQDVTITGEAGVSDFTIAPADSGIPGLTLTVLNSINAGDGLFLGDTISATVLIDYTRLDDQNFKIAGEYAYNVDDNIVFEVVETGTDLTNPYNGTIVRVTDTAGKMRPVEATLYKDGVNDQSDYIVLDNTGLSFRLQGLEADLGTYQKGLRAGDVYTLALDIGAATGPKSVLILNGIAGNTVGRTDSSEDLEIECVELRTEFDGWIPKNGPANSAQWVSNSDRINDDDLSVNANFGINVFEDMKISQPDRAAGFKWCRIANSSAGRLYSHYKAWIPAYENEAIGFTESLSPKAYGAVYDDFGKVDVENPLAMGISQCLAGAQGRGIYVSRVESDDLKGYETSLERAEKNSNIYAICPLTDDIDVQIATLNHVNKMSTESIKRWRRAYIGTDSPDTYQKIGPDLVTEKRPVSSVTEYLGANTRVVDENGRFADLEIREGDLFRTNYRLELTGETAYDEFIVAAVVDNSELILKSGPAEGWTISKDYEVWKTDSVVNVVDYVADRSKRFDSRRVVNVWVDRPLFDTENS